MKKGWLVNLGKSVIFYYFTQCANARRKAKCTMGMQCVVCGKKPLLGNQISRRGKAKYLGGVGRKITGITRRKFKPNLQSIQVIDDQGTVKRCRVCVQCIRSGKVRRPLKRKPFQMTTV